MGQVRGQHGGLGVTDVEVDDDLDLAAGQVGFAPVAVAGSAVITKLIDIAGGLSDDAMEAQISVEADQYIPYPLDEVAIDFEVQGPSERGGGQVEVLLAACRRENVDSRVEVIEAADLVPRVVDVEIYAMERAFDLIIDQLGLDEDYTVVTAEDGAAGVAKAAAERPDLVLMDLSLPVIDGWEAVRRIKADPATASIPVIAVTAHAMSGDEAKARAAGCDDFLTKPIDEDLLFAALRRWLA